MKCFSNLTIVEDVKLTNKQKIILKHIEELNYLQEINGDILKHISLPYNLEYTPMSNELIKILKKVMCL